VLKTFCGKLIYNYNYKRYLMAIFKEHHFLGLFLLTWSMLSSCGAPKSPESAPMARRVDLDVPKDQVTHSQLKRTALGLRRIFKDGISTMSLGEIIESMALEGPVTEVIPGILAAFPNPVSLECKGSLCQGASDGSAHSFVAKFVNLPLFGNPTVYLAPHIEMDLKLSDDGSRLEVCRILGVRVKARGFGGNLDGLFFNLTNDEIDAFKVDVGSGGSYPTQNCAVDSMTQAKSQQN
jgi:hypothetical protein